LDVEGHRALATTTICPSFSGPTRLMLGMLYGAGEQARFDDVVFDPR
jgi:hypothetical protein